jgi:hypothetical protein
LHTGWQHFFLIVVYPHTLPLPAFVSVKISYSRQ